jgi:ABC-type amino acid transport substrate-binding protein
LTALREARLGVVGGTSWADAALAAGVPATRTETFPELGAVLQALRSRRVTATVTSLVDATLAIRKEPELQAGLFLGSPGRACYAVRKADASLREALDQYLDGTRKTGNWSRLVVRYFGDDALNILGRAKKE